MFLCSYILQMQSTFTTEAFYTNTEETMSATQIAYCKEVATIMKFKYNSDEDVVRENRGFYTYVTKNDDELVSSLSIIHEKFIDPTDGTEHDVLCIYSVCTSEKYRRQSHAKNLMLHALKNYITLNHLINPMVAIHISFNMEMVGINYAFYYALGFTKGALTKHCARDYKSRYNEILKMNDLRVVFQDIKKRL